MKSLFGLLAITITLASCSNDNSLDFSGVDSALTVQPTQVMVLGTSHLTNYSDDISLDELEPLLNRLEAYAPDVITIEASSGMTCNRARVYEREHIGYGDYYCFDGSPFREESGLSVQEGSFQARKALLEWPESPNASQRRALAAAFIASEEPESALVQWFQLDSSDRVSGEGLGPKSMAMLERRSQSINEIRSIAARLAARRGLERVYYADDHGSFLSAAGEDEAWGARLSELWPSEGDSCKTQGESVTAKLTGGDIIGAYREQNSVNWQRKKMDCDFKRTMNDAQSGQYGRKYTMGWQARNLRMVSVIMSAASTEPGGRVLSIVGASHKPYFEAYLDQMHDVEVVKTDELLK